MEQASVRAGERRDIRDSGSFVISGLSAGHGLFHTLNQGLIILLPEIKAAFLLSDIGVGAIAATSQAAHGVISAPAGIAMDMMHHRWGLVLAVCMGIFGLGWLIVGSAPVFPILLVGVGLASLASSVWHLPAAASLSQHFPKKRATALSIHAIGGNIGDVVGPLITAGVLLGFLSWRGIISTYAAIPLLMVVVVLWAFRNIGRGPGPQREAPTLQGQLKLTRRLLKSRVLWGINLVSALRDMTFISLITFLPIYFDEDLGMSALARGLHIALLMVVGMLSTPALGYLSDRFGRKVVLVPGLIALCALTLLLVPFGEGIPLIIIIALLSFFLYGDQPILTAAALDIVGQRVVTTTLGILSFARVGPSAAAPLIAGALYQTIGIEATFYFVASIFALSAAILAFLPLTGSLDLADD